MLILAWTLGGSCSSSGEITPVRGSRISLLVEAAGGRLMVTSSRFWELKGVAGPQEPSVVRRFVPADLRVKLEGIQRGEYTLLPLGSDGAWHEKTSAELILDQESEWRLPLEASTKNPRELWNAVPLRVELRSNATGSWSMTLATRDLVAPGGMGELKRNKAGSVWMERVQHFPLQEGRRTDGEVRTRSQPRDIPLDIQAGGVSRTEARWHSNLHPPALSFRWADPLPVTVEGPGKLRSGGTLEEGSLARLAPASEGGFGGTTVRFTWDFRLGEPPDVGWWEPAEAGLDKWMPSFGDAVRFRVKLSRREGVEALRFVLRETTQHPGVAVNAAHVHLVDPAGAAPVAGKDEVAVELKEGQTVLAWKRQYPVAVADARDSFPDVFFDQARNPSGIVEGETLSGPSGGRQGTELRFEKLAPEVTGVLTVGDWAAAGVLTVQARMDGVWEEMRARGPGLEKDEVSIRFPVDEDGDGIADAFAGGKGAGADGDGDGLDAMEEYRGILAGGRHVRLDPQKRDVFLLDYGQALSQAMREEVARNLAGDGMQAHWIGLAEHRAERVGRAARVLVVERLVTNALPRILGETDAQAQVRGWQAIRPRPGVGTVFVDGTTGSRWLAQDVKRALDTGKKGGK